MAGELEARCRCCRIPVNGPRAVAQRCIMCDRCDGRHGPELYAFVKALIAAGRIPVGLAWARLMLDDAWYAGKIVWIVDENRTAHPRVREAPKRYEVVIAHAIARDEMPDLETVCGACLAPYLGESATRATMQALADDLTTALCFIDPNVLSVDVDCKRDALDPEHLLIHVNTRTAVAPGAITMPGGDVEIPASVMRAKPAEA